MPRLTRPAATIAVARTAGRTPSIGAAPGSAVSASGRISIEPKKTRRTAGNRSVTRRFSRRREVSRSSISSIAADPGGRRRRAPVARAEDVGGGSAVHAASAAAPSDAVGAVRVRLCDQLQEALLERPPRGAQLGEKEPVLGAPCRENGDRARVRRAAREPVAARRPVVLDRAAQRRPEPGEDHGVDRGVPAVHRRKAESERGRRFRHELGRRSRGEDSPVVHDDHVVRQPLDVRELVRGQEDRPSGRPQVADERADGRLRRRVHSGGRLVEHQELRAPDEGQGEGQPLLLAAREELVAPSRPRGSARAARAGRRDRPARRRGGRGAGRARAAGRRA